MRTVLFYLCLAAVVIGLLWAIALFIPSDVNKGMNGHQILNLLFRPILLILLGAIGAFTSQRKF
jgi:hypothetical protein